MIPGSSELLPDPEGRRDGERREQKKRGAPPFPRFAKYAGGKDDGAEKEQLSEFPGSFLDLTGEKECRERRPDPRRDTEEKRAPRAAAAEEAPDPAAPLAVEQEPRDPHAERDLLPGDAERKEGDEAGESDQGDGASRAHRSDPSTTEA
jgi:hypothetical protein